MTGLKRPVKRESGACYRGRALMVELHSRHIVLREKGRRDSLTVDLLTLYDFAWKLRWRKEEAEKREAKKGRKSRGVE